MKKRKTKRKLKPSLRFLEGTLAEYKANLLDANKRILNFQRRVEELETRLIHEQKYGHGTFIWTTRDGEDVRPQQMSEEHLRNAICFCQRRLTYAFGTTRWLSTTKFYVRAFYEFLLEAERRGIRV